MQGETDCWKRISQLLNRKTSSDSLPAKEQCDAFDDSWWLKEAEVIIDETEEGLEKVKSMK